MRLYRSFCLILISVLCLTAATAPAKPGSLDAITMKIQTSQALPFVGSGLCVMAEIRNISDSVVLRHRVAVTEFWGARAFDKLLPHGGSSPSVTFTSTAAPEDPGGTDGFPDPRGIPGRPGRRRVNA
jgi:hypothetical protein